MKKKIITIITVVIISLSAIVGFIFGLFSVTKGRYSPLQYCLWEIQNNEGYNEEFTYTFEELEPKSEMQKEAHKDCVIYAYYITVFTNDRKGEWYCFIECKMPWYISGFGEPKGYRPSEVIAIDCDLAIETYYGYYGAEENE